MLVRQVSWLTISRWLFGVWILCGVCGCERPLDGSAPQPFVAESVAVQRPQENAADRSPESSPDADPNLSPREDAAPAGGSKSAGGDVGADGGHSEPTDGNVDDFAAIARSLRESSAAAPALAGASSETAGRPQRWAILGTPAMQDSGLSDLLLAKLSSLDGVELV